jgi:hypothetical protein
MPRPAGILAEYKRRYAPDLFVAGVITDFVVHKWWLYEGINTYFLATEAASGTVTAAGCSFFAGAAVYPGRPVFLSAGISAA